MSAHTPGPTKLCGCYPVVGSSDIRIVYCPTHAAAPKMKDELRQMVEFLSGSGRGVALKYDVSDAVKLLRELGE